MERYELVEGTTAKFWQWEVRGSDLVVQYGRIGSAGKEQVKSFPDEDEARKAAAKLMREKTGKGYGLVGATVEKASINKDPVDAELVALAKKVAAKREYASDSIKYLKSQVTARRAMPLLWTMAANGLLPAKALTAQLPTLAEDVEWASPSELVAVLERVPKTFEANRNVLWLLDNYPEFVDTLLMHAAWRAPKELAAAKLGPNVARALPFVRRRLGLETEAPDSAQLVELVRHHMDCRARSASATVWPHLATSDATGTLAIASGRLSVGSPDALDIGSVELDREVPKGNHPVTVYWSDADLDALPTAGVEAVMLRFAQSAPASWEEAKTTKGKKAIHVSNLITFCWLDASAKLDELANDAQKTFEDATTDGVVLTDDNQVAAVYVGEIATMHKMFWGLGEDGAPVCLVAGFRYPSED